MSIQEAKKNLESVVAKAKLAVALAAQEYVAALVRHSLGTAEAAQATTRPGPRKAAKRKPKGQRRKVEKAAAKVTTKAPAPKTERRKRTSAADIARHKEIVLAACRDVGKRSVSFNRGTVQGEIAVESIDVGRMLSLLTKEKAIGKTGDRRNTLYTLSAKNKPNGAVEHVVVRDAELVGGEG